jgi:hypothetical protein
MRTALLLLDGSRSALFPLDTPQARSGGIRLSKNTLRIHKAT